MCSVERVDDALLQRALAVMSQHTVPPTAATEAAVNDSESAWTHLNWEQWLVLLRELSFYTVITLKFQQIVSVY